VFLHCVCQEIVVGESDIVLAGGTENMSQAPFAVRDIRWGTRFGSDLKVYTEINLNSLDFLV
jgi:acetyl-CoA acetyltransferase